MTTQDETEWQDLYLVGWKTLWLPVFSPFPTMASKSFFPQDW